MAKKYILALAVISALILVTAASCGNSENQQQLNTLATCLADKGVKEYGAFWCPHCADQKKMFGKAYDIILERGVYVECDPRCVPDAGGRLPTACKGQRANVDECLIKGVDGYPTWILPEGKRLEGTQSLETLARVAGCEYSASAG
ncbi:MAG TPA: hypothetical protein HA282_03090 [Nanoarchaeota archaeon]|nr:MAG: thioredoxin-like protein [archaeon GW2011_AR6]MBS3082902.1 hypothetical protein [Candidatus Pacearchaeota archaeon]HIH18117.1 hypothetical protein [Nanoarchaeota archaeon]HIH34485.1 hypothetical protein [Nanoarchaeota archaeon]HIH51566.1 hypothetical protein [Nanoarchaeota archaeon]